MMKSINDIYQSELMKELGIRSRVTMLNLIKKLEITTYKDGRSNVIRETDAQTIRNHHQNKSKPKPKQIRERTQPVIKPVASPIPPWYKKSVKHPQWIWAIYIFSLLVESLTMMNLILSVTFTESTSNILIAVHITLSMSMSLTIYLGLFMITVHHKDMHKDDTGDAFVKVFVLFNCILNLVQLFQNPTANMYIGIAKFLLAIGGPIMMYVLHHLIVKKKL